MTTIDRDTDALLARIAIETGNASTLPTADGRGLTDHERTRVNAARNEALYRAGRYADDNADTYPFECAAVAADVALRVVLASRPRPEPEADADTDPADWPAWTDADRWEPTDPEQSDHPFDDDERFEPSPDDRAAWAMMTEAPRSRPRNDLTDEDHLVAFGHV